MLQMKNELMSAFDVFRLIMVAYMLCILPWSLAKQLNIVQYTKLCPKRKSPKRKQLNAIIYYTIGTP